MTRHAALLLCLLTCAPSARAAEMCDLVADLNLIVSAETGYQTPPCPDIGFAELPAAGGVRSQAGAYFPDTGRIELAPDLDLATVYGQSYLLHELVHAAQYAAGTDRKVPCPAALEAEAYSVQATFLRRNGLEPEAQTISILAMQLGMCGQSDY